MGLRRWAGYSIAVLLIVGGSSAPRAQIDRERAGAVVQQHQLQSSALAQALTERPAESVQIGVSGTETLTVEPVSAERSGSGGLIWRGRVQGRSHSSVTIALTDGGLFGLIDAGEHRYQIRSGTARGYIVEELDYSRFPREAQPLPVDPAIAAAPAAQLDHPADDGSTIDVMVIYTQAARSGAGGTSAMSALIDLAISRANTAYANSGVTQRLRLVHREEIAYVESGSAATDLARLRNQDGTMDGVHALRDRYAADFVSLFTATTDVCGVGYLLAPMSAALASYAFNVTAWHCAAGNLSFAHELGHNMGLEHDDANAASTPSSPYAYGYRDPGFFRDVMAYACEPDGLPPCDRVPHFSTHTRTYAGRVTGVAGAAEAARALDDTAPITANFRSGRPNQNAPALDLNGDGRLDLLWRHDLDGRINGWVMNGTSRVGVAAPAPNQVADVSWTIAGTGDLDGDGQFDIVWQNVADGRVSAWFMNGLTLREGALFSIPQVSDLRWRIRSVGDLDGDGKADVFWQHDDGSVAVWRMNGLTVVEGTLLSPSNVGDTAWRLAGTADFDGDGRRDLLWQHDGEGSLALWLMDGTSRIGLTALYPNQVPDTAWKIRAIGDVDGDGDADLIWQHTDGRVSAWIMNGVVLVDGHLLSPTHSDGPGWKIVGPK